MDKLNYTDGPRKFYMGCKKSKLDGTEKQYHQHFQSRDLILPNKVDLRDTGFVPPILDQKNLGSCTSQATSSALLYAMNKEGLENPFEPSRLFIYYFTRFLEDTVNEDAGAELGDVMKTIFAFGVPPETEWPYDITKFKEKPSLNAIKSARKHLDNFEYFSVKVDLKSIKQVLADGYPVIIGIALFESFFYEETLKTGIVPIPKVTEPITGGHALLIVAYDDETGFLKVKNSWSTNVGQEGYFDIPYDYIANPNLGMDFWSIRSFK